MYHYPVHAGTGGHYDPNGVIDEYMGSSYLSSASKRQRVECAYKNLIPGPNLLVSQSVPMTNGY